MAVSSKQKQSNMNFAEFYSKRYSVNPKIFDDSPRSDTGIIVVIPCYDDEFIFETLASLNSAQKPDCSVEVIVVVNSAEDTPSQIIAKNRKIYSDLCKKANDFSNFTLKPHIIENVPRKIAGVGNARKIGMDEAVKRFGELEKSNGIIVSLDADCLVDSEYFSQIYNTFTKNHKSVKACTLQFQHDFDEKKYPIADINACRRYELYLRYFRLAQKISRIPNCLHTIGSCFAVTADSYAQMGGMSRRQAGEDFYFLQKQAQLANVAGIQKPIVFPSPKISTRVPFGTGQAVKKIVETDTCKVYNFDLFLLLKGFYSKFYDLYSDNNQTIPNEILTFVGEEKFASIVDECRQNTSNAKSFEKRMFAKFDVFFMIRFLNGFDEFSAFPPQEVEIVATKLLKYFNYEMTNCLYDNLLNLDLSVLN